MFYCDNNYMTQETEPTPIPGFTFSKKKEGEWVYSVDMQYRNGRRNFQLMPVNPQYEILRGVELLGYPHVITHEKMARCPRTEEAGTKGLPTVDDLTDEEFYRKNLESEALTEYLDPPIGEISVSGHVSSPIEIHPYAKNVFMFPSISVDYTYGIQNLGRKSLTAVITDAKPRAFNKGMIILSKEQTDFDGLAYVAHVRVLANFRDYFESPREMREFNGKLPSSDQFNGERIIGKSLTHELFNKFFALYLDQIGQQVEKKRKMNVKGVLLSPIKTNVRMSDSGLTIGCSPEGEFVIAASYLV